MSPGISGCQRVKHEVPSRPIAWDCVRAKAGCCVLECLSVLEHPSWCVGLDLNGAEVSARFAELRGKPWLVGQRWHRVLRPLEPGAKPATSAQAMPGDSSRSSSPDAKAEPGVSGEEQSALPEVPKVVPRASMATLSLPARAGRTSRTRGRLSVLQADALKSSRAALEQRHSAILSSSVASMASMASNASNASNASKREQRGYSGSYYRQCDATVLQLRAPTEPGGCPESDF